MSIQAAYILVKLLQDNLNARQLHYFLSKLFENQLITVLKGLILLHFNKSIKLNC